MSEFKPIKQEKTVISIRLDVDMLKTIDEISAEADMNLLFSVLIMLLKILNVE